MTFYAHPHSGWLFGLLFEQTSLKALIKNRLSGRFCFAGKLKTPLMRLANLHQLLPPIFIGEVAERSEVGGVVKTKNLGSLSTVGVKS